MAYMTVKKFAEKLGVTTQTLRTWDKSGKLKPVYRSESGYRYYSDEQLAQCTGIKPVEEKLIVGYCRVGTDKQGNSLEDQVNSVRQYCIAKGYSFKIITDMGSGVDYTKSGLQELLTLVMTNQVSKVVVLYRGTLASYGYELIEFICKCHNVEIEVIDNTERIGQQELIDDLVQIVTDFNSRLTDRQLNKIIAELKEGGKNICQF